MNNANLMICTQCHRYYEASDMFDSTTCLNCVSDELAEEKLKSKETGKKFDKGKPRMDLIPPEAIFAIAEVLRYGAEEKKYGERNWEKGIKATRLFAAAQRHLWKWMSGKDIDEESNLPHLHHAICELAMLIATVERMPHLDDRPKVEQKDV